MKKIFVILLLCVLVGGATFFGYYKYISHTLGENKSKNNSDTSSQPMQSDQDSISTSSLSFIDESSTSTGNPPLSLQEKKDEITISSIQENQGVSSPVVIEGEAKSDWFFEGQFPVYVMDNERRIVGNGNAVAKENWMSDGLVPFIATIDFNVDAASGFIILEKNNPSGLAEKKVSVQIPVQLVQKSPVREVGGCKISGCSGQICSDEEVPSNCMYKEEYICYQKATCERQSTGQCGWTQTKVLTQCLEQFAD